jgi:hypothetical protein
MAKSTWLAPSDLSTGTARRQLVTPGAEMVGTPLSATVTSALISPSVKRTVAHGVGRPSGTCTGLPQGTSLVLAQVYLGPLGPSWRTFRATILPAVSRAGINRPLPATKTTRSFLSEKPGTVSTVSRPYLSSRPSTAWRTRVASAVR